MSTLLALTHVASQLVYRWLPPPLPRTAFAKPEPPLASLRTADEWRSVALDALTDGGLPWLAAYMQRSDADASLLAAAAAAHFAALRAAGGHYLSFDDPLYPRTLAHLPDPPLGLSLLGDVSLLTRPAVAVVGSRKASALAVRESFQLGRALAEAGWLVVSGGAYGCDIAAHHGVLTAALEPAPAACVFAGGLATLYPRGNDAVFRRLRERKALLVSERLWTAACRPVDFTARNRIIAGLAPLTVVMQAAERSGALVTARLALDQGRDVMVLAHPPGDVRAVGSATLLADGAASFSSACELMERLTFSAGSPDTTERARVPLTASSRPESLP